MRPRFVSRSFRGPYLKRRDVLTASRTKLRLPHEALEFAVGVTQLGQRIYVVLGRIEIVDTVQVAILEFGRHHFGFHLVHRADTLLFLDEEDGIGASQTVETAKRRGAVEVCEDFGRADLVEKSLGFLSHNHRVVLKGHTVDSIADDEGKEAVGGILAVAVVPYYGVDVESGDGVQLVIAEGVAAYLYIVTVYADIALGVEEADLGGIERGDDRVGGSDHRRVRRDHRRVRRDHPVIFGRFCG